MKLKDIKPFKKPLKELTMEEMLSVLENNENTDIRILACICSEVLRRLLVKDGLK